MEFSAEQRNAATGMVIARPKLAIHQAIDLQCQLNAAVELLREAGEYTRHCSAPECGKNQLYLQITDFLSAFPAAEGEPK